MNAPSFVFLGDSGCGKTTLLACMYDVLKHGYGDYSIKCEPEADNVLSVMVNNLKKHMQYSAATVDCLEYNFSLYCKERHVYNFACIDFPGELLREQNTEEFKLLGNQIIQSPCCYICVDSDCFLENGKMISDEDVIVNNIRKSSQHIIDYISSVQRTNTIQAAIIITKCDLISNNISPVSLKNIIKRAFIELFDTNYSIHQSIVAVFQVSVGNRIYTPIRIHLPLLYGILWTLTRNVIYNTIEQKSCYDNNAELVSIKNNTLEKINQLDSKKKNIFNRRSIKKKIEKEKLVLNNIEENIISNNVQNDLLAEDNKKSEFFVKKIFNELELSGQQVFLNGKGVKWDTIRQEYWSDV